MADEMTQEQTATPAPAAQETVAAVVQGDTTQQVPASTTESTPEQQPETSPSTTPEIEEWNGNDVDSLPKPLQARARGMLRKFHEVTQEAAQVRNQAQAYQEIVNHPEFQEFVQWKEQHLNNPAAGNQQVTNQPLSEDDFLAAQTDPAKFQEVHDRLLMQKAQPILQKLDRLEQKLAAYDHEKVQEKAARKLDAFAKQHPDFWDVNPVIMKAVLEDVVQKRGGTLEDAYNSAKSLEKTYLEKANGKIKQQVEAKKQAVSASPSKSMEPEIVYVKDKHERNRVSFEHAKLDKRVDVRIKK